MADRIKGITVEIGGDTTGLSKALSGVNKEIRNTQSQLRDVNRLLKLDPSNAELLSQKQRLFAQAVDETKTKLTQLKNVQDQMDAGLKSGSVTQQQYDAWQREIVATENELKNLQDQTKNTDTAVSATLKEAGSKVSAVGDKISGVGDKMTRNVTAPIVGIGAASLAAFSEVDSGMDIIVTKTGATGDALKSMQDIAKGIATTIPTSFEEAGTAVGEVNTRFGLTGDALKKLSTQFIEFASINNTDVNSAIGNTQKILSQFGLSASDAGNVLGLLTSVSQKTGISVDDLGNLLQQNGATFKEMGLGVGESITLMGNFEKAGIDSASMLTGLKKAATNYSKEGKSMEQGLGDLISRLKNSGTEADATAEAYSLFGAKGGLAFITAAKEGRISLDGLSTDLSSFGSTVDDTYKGTLDGIDSMTTAFNALKLAGAAVGEAVGNTLAPMLQGLAAALTDFAAWFSGLPPGIQNLIVVIALVVAAVGPVLIVVGKIISAVGTIMTIPPTVMNAIAAVKTAVSALHVVLLANPIALVIAAIVALVAAFIYLWNTNEEFRQFWIGLWNTIRDTAMAAWTAISSAVTTAVTAIGVFLTTAWQTIQAVMTTILSAIQTVIITTWNAIRSVIGTIVNGISATISAVWSGIRSTVLAVMGGISSTVSSVWNGIRSAVASIVHGIASTVSSVWGNIRQAVSSAVGAIQSAVAGAFSAMSGAVSGAVFGICGTIRDGFGSAVSYITGLASSAWSWGADIIGGIVDGIQSGIGRIRDAAGSVASTIRSYLHFSVPDIGPLTDYESWMPDFMSGLAYGIEKSKGLVSKAMNGVSADMVVSPKMSSAAVPASGSASQNTENALSGVTNAITSAVSQMSGQQGDIVIPVYLGGTLLDEVIVNAQQRTNLRSGGR